MPRSAFAGSTDYSYQSLDDILADLNDWLTALMSTLEFLQASTAQLQNNSYWDNVPDEMKNLVAYASKFFETSIKEITEIHRELQIEVQQNHVARLQNLAEIAIRLNGKFGLIWHREYKHKDYGNPDFAIVERMYAQGRDMVVDMLDIGNVAGRLVHYVGRRNSQLSNQENTPVTIFIDNSQHINQSGGISVHSEGDTNIGGDVVGRDKVIQE